MFQIHKVIKRSLVDKVNGFLDKLVGTRRVENEMGKIYRFRGKYKHGVAEEYHIPEWVLDRVLFIPEDMENVGRREEVRGMFEEDMRGNKRKMGYNMLIVRLNLYCAYLCYEEICDYDDGIERQMYQVGKKIMRFPMHRPQMALEGAWMKFTPEDRLTYFIQYINNK